MSRFWLAIGSLFLVVHCCPAEEWPQFRGPEGSGMTKAGEYPTHWNAKDSIRWSVDLPRPGNGSPIVCAGKVFVTSAEDERGHDRSLLCFDADSGKRLWTQSVHVAEAMPTHKTNPYAGSTPACDGKRVVVWHATGGLHAYGIDGQPLWSRDLGEFRHMWGYGSSPLIIDDRVLLNSGPGKQVFVAAFDVESGETIWRHDEPVEGDGQHNAQGKYMGTWSTPVTIERDGRRLAVVALHQRIVAFEVASGKIAWFYRVTSDRGDLAYSSPLVHGDLCLYNAGFKGPAMAFRINGGGDLTDQEVWKVDGNPQSIGTGIVVDGHLYRPGAGPNLIECIDLETGQSRWQQRNRGAFWGSIAAAGSIAYVTDQRGTTVVFRPSPERFAEISQNDLDDGCNATPALANDRIYLRTDSKLWCIE